MSQVQWCPNCHRMLGISCACGLSFREKALTLQINRENFDTGEKRNYYSRESVNALFGEDSRQRMMEETKGVGPVKRGRDGRFYRFNREAQRQEPLTGKQVEYFLGSDTEG